MKQEKILRECRFGWLEKTFGLVQIKMLPSLKSWLASSETVTERQKENLLDLQEPLDFNVRNWNEQELDRHFIGPILSMVSYSTLKYNFYSERVVDSIVGDWRLYGKPDCSLASGRRDPEMPYFAFQEYKKMTDPDGDPRRTSVRRNARGTVFERRRFADVRLPRHWRRLVFYDFSR